MALWSIDCCSVAADSLSNIAFLSSEEDPVQGFITPFKFFHLGILIVLLVRTGILIANNHLALSYSPIAS